MKLPKVTEVTWFAVVVVIWALLMTIYTIENEAVRGMFG